MIDLDGYSSFGGLRSAVQFPNVNEQKLQLATAIYYDAPEDWEGEVQRLRRKYEPDELFPLDNLYCDLDSIAAGLMESQRELPTLTEVAEPFRLPSESGNPTGIGQNLAVNLSDMFEVLYEDIGEIPPEQAAQEREDFFHGDTAAWSGIRTTDKSRGSFFWQMIPSAVGNG